LSFALREAATARFLRDRLSTMYGGPTRARIGCDQGRIVQNRNARRRPCLFRSGGLPRYSAPGVRVRAAASPTSRSRYRILSCRVPWDAPEASPWHWSRFLADPDVRPVFVEQHRASPV